MGGNLKLTTLKYKEKKNTSDTTVVFNLPFLTVQNDTGSEDSKVSQD